MKNRRTIFTNLQKKEERELFSQIKEMYLITMPFLIIVSIIITILVVHGKLYTIAFEKIAFFTLKMPTISLLIITVCSFILLLIKKSYCANYKEKSERIIKRLKWFIISLFLLNTSLIFAFFYSDGYYLINHFTFQNLGIFIFVLIALVIVFITVSYCICIAINLLATIQKVKLML